MTLDGRRRPWRRRRQDRVPDRRRPVPDVRRAVPGHRRRRPHRAVLRDRRRRTSPTSSRPRRSACGSTRTAPETASTSRGRRARTAAGRGDARPRRTAPGSGAVLDAVPRRRRRRGRRTPADGRADLRRHAGVARRSGRTAGDGGFELLGDDSGGSVRPRAAAWACSGTRSSAYGDFSLQARVPRGPRRTAGYSNGGVFVRFPNPRRGRRARRHVRPGRGSAGETRPEWVAIYCGHEIQLYDGPTGEPQKTGSIYNFDRTTSRRPSRVAEGRVERLRDPQVVGQHYRSSATARSSTEFENSTGQDVVARGRSADAASASSRRATSACRTTAAPTGWTTATSASRTSRRTRRAPADRPFTVDGRRPAHGRVPLGRRRRQRRGEEGPRLRDRRGRAAGPGRAGSTPVPPMTDTPATAALRRASPRASAPSASASAASPSRWPAPARWRARRRSKLSKRAARTLKARQAHGRRRRAVRCYGAHTAKRHAQAVQGAQAQAGQVAQAASGAAR